ncbi:hypothetical protein EMCRGX_G012145 [Ephydatia muelleri]
MRSVFFSPGSTQSLPCHTASGDNCTSSICPNTVVTYTCTITSGTAGGLTDWTLPTGTLDYVWLNIPPAHVDLTQLPAYSPLIAIHLYCLSSILTVNITAAMNGSTVTCYNTNYLNESISILISLATINVAALPGHPNAVANTIGPDMVLVVVNPSSSGGLPTSYNVTISNSSYVYSNSTSAFLNGSAMVTFTGLTIGTTYTISAVAINCAGSSNPTTIYISSKLNENDGQLDTTKRELLPAPAADNPKQLPCNSTHRNQTPSIEPVMVATGQVQGGPKGFSHDVPDSGTAPEGSQSCVSLESPTMLNGLVAVSQGQGAFLSDVP